MGRPSKYSIELTNKICERMIEGESLNQICNGEDMPGKTTVFRWLTEHEEFRDNYARARELMVDSFADEILDVADDGQNDYMERINEDGESSGWQVNHEHINRSRLRVDTRKWLMSKLLPKKYGDVSKVELTGKDGAAIVPVINIYGKN